MGFFSNALAKRKAKKEKEEAEWQARKKGWELDSTVFSIYRGDTNFNSEENPTPMTLDDENLREIGEAKIYVPPYDRRKGHTLIENGKVLCSEYRICLYHYGSVEYIRDDIRKWHSVLPTPGGMLKAGLLNMAQEMDDPCLRDPKKKWYYAKSFWFECVDGIRKTTSTIHLLAEDNCRKLVSTVEGLTYQTRPKEAEIYPLFDLEAALTPVSERKTLRKEQYLEQLRGKGHIPYVDTLFYY